MIEVHVKMEFAIVIMDTQERHAKLFVCMVAMDTGNFYDIKNKFL